MALIKVEILLCNAKSVFTVNHLEHAEHLDEKAKCRRLDVSGAVFQIYGLFLLEMQDSIPDVVRAIAGILQSPNAAVLAMGSEVTVKLINVMPTLMLRPHFNHLTHSLSPLLSTSQSQVAIMTASALHLIVSNIGAKKEKEAWEILEKHNTVTQVIGNLRAFSGKGEPMEYFTEMASLLSSIMQLWPVSRYLVWNDSKLMEVMEVFCNNPEATVKVAVLQLYSSLGIP